MSTPTTSEDSLVTFASGAAMQSTWPLCPWRRLKTKYPPFACGVAMLSVQRGRRQGQQERESRWSADGKLTVPGRDLRRLVARSTMTSQPAPSGDRRHPCALSPSLARPAVGCRAFKSYTNNLRSLLHSYSSVWETSQTNAYLVDFWSARIAEPAGHCGHHKIIEFSSVSFH